ncbi:pentatricopeptide repeat-containing protein At1g15510, chloroplastic-like [Miscanthus floridulus]|uniref:pentatricopeptide repeat-containing protein At1g15510, chloroplastic-like n=1 Tax=Miscanthus floridulus TaxID=154761 RepID=UPI00345896B0
MILRWVVSLILHGATTSSRAHATIAAHAAATKAGHAADVFLSNHLTVTYARSGLLEAARRVFGEMPRRNLVSWSALISGCAQAGRPDLALELFARMGDVRPNEHVYASVARSCAALQALAAGAQVHAHAVKSGSLGASFVANSVVSMYMKCGCYEAGYNVFRTLFELNLVSHNALISGTKLDLMKLRGLHPDRFSYAAALVIRSNLENSGIAAALHCDTVKIGLDVTAFVGIVILGIVVPTRKLKLFKDMVDASVCPDNFTFASALAARGELSLFRHGSEVHGHLIRSRDDVDVAASNAIMSMYASCATMPDWSAQAWSISTPWAKHTASHRELREGHVQASAFRDDPVVLGSLLSACRVHGDTDVGGRVAERLLALGPATSSPYVLLSHLYASGGRWDGVAEAWRMLEDGAAKKKDAGCSAVGFR